MQSAQLEYTPTSDNAAFPLAITIYSDRPQTRDEMAEDVSRAGLHIRQQASLGEFAGAHSASLGEIILLDCPAINAATMVALARLDMRVAQTGARLVVSTTLDALEDVFACLDQSSPRILVAPTRGERVIALGHELTKIDRVRVRENSDPETITLLRLSEQVSELARKLDLLANDEEQGANKSTRLASPGNDYRGPEDDEPNSLLGSARPALPDPRLVRRIIRHRQARGRFFEGELFADPAWDILLDLTAARAENERVSVTSLCIASGVPPTTALRWISQMTESGILQRVEDEQDRRRAFIALSDSAADAMARYFAEIAKDGPLPL